MLQLRNFSFYSIMSFLFVEAVLVVVVVLLVEVLFGVAVVVIVVCVDNVEIE